MRGGYPAAAAPSDAPPTVAPAMIRPAPTFRAVDQHTGQVADPATLPAAYQVIDGLVGERDRAITQRDDARAELDNMVNLAKEVGRLGKYLENALDDRDSVREDRDIIEYKLDVALCRVQELEAELAHEKATGDEFQAQIMSLRTDFIAQLAEIAALKAELATARAVNS